MLACCAGSVWWRDLEMAGKSRRCLELSSEESVEQFVLSYVVTALGLSVAMPMERRQQDREIFINISLVTR